MNERIFDMAIKCGIIVMDQHGEDNSDAVQEFAELIVKECIDIAYKEGDNVAYLALHFGVEE